MKSARRRHESVLKHSPMCPCCKMCMCKMKMHVAGAPEVSLEK